MFTGIHLSEIVKFFLIYPVKWTELSRPNVADEWLKLLPVLRNRKVPGRRLPILTHLFSWFSCPSRHIPG
jgi:hypothetical protein